MPGVSFVPGANASTSAARRRLAAVVCSNGAYGTNTVRPLATAGVVGWYIDASAATVPVNPISASTCASPEVAADEVRSSTTAGDPVASWPAIGVRSGNGAGGAGTVTVDATWNPAARSDAPAWAARAAPSSPSSTARFTVEPCAVPSNERRPAPHAGLTTLLCSAACAPTNPKPKRLPSHAVVDAEPTNGAEACANVVVSRVSLTAGTTAKTVAAAAAVSAALPAYSTVRPATPPRRFARAKRAWAPISAPTDAGSTPTRPPTVTVVRVTPIAVVGLEVAAPAVGATAAVVATATTERRAKNNR